MLLHPTEFPEPCGTVAASVVDMTREHNSHTYALGAAVILAGGALVELTRLVLQTPWQGWTLWFSNTVSTLLVIVWSSAAASTLLRRKQRFLAQVAWAFSLIAPVVMIIHGLFVRLGGQWAGLLYVVGGASVGFCLKRTWDGAESRWLRRSATKSWSEPESHSTH